MGENIKSGIQLPGPPMPAPPTPGKGKYLVVGNPTGDLMTFVISAAGDIAVYDSAGQRTVVPIGGTLPIPVPAGHSDGLLITAFDPMADVPPVDCVSEPPGGWAALSAERQYP